MEENLNQTPAEAPGTGENPTKAPPESRRVGRLLWVAILGAVIAGAGIGAVHVLSSVKQAPQKMKISGPLTRKSNLSTMEGFVVPFREKGKYTCLTLDLVFEWSDKNAEKELRPRAAEIRGLIYEGLRQKLQETDDVPEAESLKKAALSAIGKVTQISRVRDVYITRLLAM